MLCAIDIWHLVGGHRRSLCISPSHFTTADSMDMIMRGRPKNDAFLSSLEVLFLVIRLRFAHRILFIWSLSVLFLMIRLRFAHRIPSFWKFPSRPLFSVYLTRPSLSISPPSVSRPLPRPVFQIKESSTAAS